MRSWTVAAQAAVSPTLVDLRWVAWNYHGMDSVMVRVPQYRGPTEAPEPEPRAGMLIHRLLPNLSGSEATVKGLARCYRVQWLLSGRRTCHPIRGAYFHFHQPANFDWPHLPREDSTKYCNYN